MLALNQCRTGAFRDLEIDALLSIGKAYASLGNSQTALEYFKESLSQSQKFPNFRGESQSLFNLGEIYSRIGHQTFGLKYYTRALVLSRQISDDNEEARVLSAIGAMQESAAEYASAVRSLNEALALNRRMNNSKAEAQTLYLLARVKAKQGTIEESLKDIEAALDITESKSYEIQSQTLRAAYAASTQQYYDLCIDLLMQLEGQRPGNGFATLAFQVSERRKARILYDLLAESSSNPYKSDPKLLEQERSVRELLSAKMAYQMSILGHELKRTDAEKIAKEIDLLKLKYQELQAQKQVAPKQSQPKLPNLSEIQRELTDDTVLLEYALGADRSYVWAITSSSVSVSELPPSERIEKVANEFYRLLKSPSWPTSQPDADTANVTEYWQQATALSRMVLEPVATELNKKRLLVAGDGVLHFIPFAALPAPYTGEGRPLIADHEIVNLPSASVLVSLRRRNIDRQQPTKAVAVIADPVFERDDPRITLKTTEDRPRRDYAVTRDASLRMPRLFYAEREASEIMALSPSKQSVAALGLNATREFVLSGQLNSYSVIHFATHGMNNSKDPELSGIALSMFNKSGEPENGLLQLHDIYSLRLSADLVVLSSCNTALGKNFPGEGPLGLTQGFMASGAQSVLSTLWKVDDEATAEFMRYFYKGMMQEGLRPAAALRNAQIEMRQQPQWQAPFYWAGFILQGDWNQDVVVESQNATGYVPESTTLLTLGIGGLFLLFNNKIRRHIRAR
jgi:CHAT domain-containing protein